MSNPVWEDVQRVAEEVRVQIHLAGMDARDQWHALEHRIEVVEQTIEHSGEAVSEAVTHEMSAIHAALIQLREKVIASARGDFVSGW